MAQSGRKPVFYKPFFRGQIISIKHLPNENHTFLSFDELKHSIHIPFTLYYGLIIAIPTGPKRMEDIKKSKQLFSNGNFNLCSTLGLPINTNRLIFSCKQSNKPSYTRKQNLKLWFHQRKFLFRFMAKYLEKIRRYSKFSLWIPIALAKIYFSRVILTWRKSFVFSKHR